MKRKITEENRLKMAFLGHLAPFFGRIIFKQNNQSNISSSKDNLE